MVCGNDEVLQRIVPRRQNDLIVRAVAEPRRGSGARRRRRVCGVVAASYRGKPAHDPGAPASVRGRHRAAHAETIEKRAPTIGAKAIFDVLSQLVEKYEVAAFFRKYP
jgi:hypothetical protein